jgi:hypothetical protein
MIAGPKDDAVPIRTLFFESGRSAAPAGERRFSRNGRQAKAYFEAGAR